jgi:FkbM family methyltransferase
MMVIDVGANIGYYALLFGALMQNKGRIICLEPDPSNLNELHLNVSNNHLGKLVAIEAVAAGSYDGTARFVPGLNSYASPTGSMTVPIRRIDNLSLSQVDFIKIDVEGYEGAVLEGAIETIGKFHPTVFLELHPHLLTKHTHEEIISTLKNTYGRVMAYRSRRESIPANLTSLRHACSERDYRSWTIHPQLRSRAGFRSVLGDSAAVKRSTVVLSRRMDSLFSLTECLRF